MSCTNWRSALEKTCVREARIVVFSKPEWSLYLDELRSAQNNDDFVLTSTQSYDFISRWYEEKRIFPQLGEIYSDDYYLRNNQTLIAVVTNYSVIYDTIDSQKAVTCVYDFPELYRSLAERHSDA